MTHSIKSTNRWAILAYIITCLILVFTSLNSRNESWKTTFEGVTVWDVAGYYIYLPAAFIYQDITKLSHYPEMLEKYRMSPYFDQATMLDNGNYVMKYSAGQAIALSPGFFAGHLYALSTDYPADGYSLPYQAGLKIWTLLIAFIGLWYLMKILTHYFSPGWAAAGILLLVLGSNYLEYSAIQGAMTHNSLFTITALLIWTTIRFYEKPNRSKALGVGILLGLAALIRPTELVLILIPLLWGLSSMQLVKERIDFFKKNPSIILITAISCILVGSIQLFYWKYVSGSWLVYSYGDQGFNFLSPYIYKGLFSTQSGWFMYSPLMLLILPGLYKMWSSGHESRWLIIAYFCAVIYITFSWKIWGYGGSLGARALVQSYPLFAIPLIFGLKFLFDKYIFTKALVVLFCIASIYINIYWTYQAHRGKYFHAGQMNDSYYFSVVGRWNLPEETLKLLDVKHIIPHEPKELILLKEIEFSETQSPENPCIDLKPDYLTGLCVPSGTVYTPRYEYETNGEQGWIRVTADLLVGHKEWDVHKSPSLVVTLENEGQTLLWQAFPIFRYFDGHENGELYMDIKLPKQPFDKIATYFGTEHYKDAILVKKIKFESVVL